MTDANTLLEATSENHNGLPVFAAAEAELIFALYAALREPDIDFTPNEAMAFVRAWLRGPRAAQ